MTSDDPCWLGGKIALITGADGGIGRATAGLFERAGAALILSDRAEACARLRQDFDKATVLAADLAAPGAAEALATEARGRHGSIDILICNAGIQGPAGSMADIGQAERDAVLAVNLLSPFALANVLAPSMAKAGGGSIVLTSSIAGLRGNKAIGLYGITKAALAQLARNLAVEWGPSGVRANAVSPGLIRTAFADTMLANDAMMERRLSLTPLRRTGSAEEVAAAILFLASGAGSFVTGHNLVVDGGTTISDGN